jgi:hypothetical protein
MILALTDAVIVLGVMAVIGLLGYLMDRQVDRGEQEEKDSNSDSWRAT